MMLMFCGALFVILAVIDAIDPRPDHDWYFLVVRSIAALYVIHYGWKERRTPRG